MAGMSIAKRFQKAGIGETLRFSMRDWNVVGVFDAGNTGFSTQRYGGMLISSCRPSARPVYSSILFQIKRLHRHLEKVKARIENDPRLTLEAKRETKYYADQSEMMAKFLRILGMSLTVIFSFGAIIGAMITMYASVANRTAEIGTLRSLGFQRSNILYSFIIEAMLLGLTGGCIGLFFASFLQLFTISTLNFQTFSELAFSFTLTFEIAYKAIIFSLVMGLDRRSAPGRQGSAG